MVVQTHYPAWFDSHINYASVWVKLISAFVWTQLASSLICFLIILHAKISLHEIARESFRSYISSLIQYLILHDATINPISHIPVVHTLRPVIEELRQPHKHLTLDRLQWRPQHGPSAPRRRLVDLEAPRRVIKTKPGC